MSDNEERKGKESLIDDKIHSIQYQNTRETKVTSICRYQPRDVTNINTVDKYKPDERRSLEASSKPKAENSQGPNKE